MSRQITFESAGSSVMALEHRVAVLERRVAALTEALQVMAQALESTVSVPAGDAKAAALRQARELLLPELPSSP
ncbi:hypothetical protein [Actinomadura sp. NPDC048394]|jgi:hypothetical protein|uniref:hypothetical protein n=1 Tax=Actinomadura sp. NPDC048394 TaxID=3158223 RepID=UPI0033C4ACF9